MTTPSAARITNFVAGNMRSLLNIHRVYENVSVEVPDEVVAASVRERITESGTFDAQEATVRYALLLMEYGNTNERSLPNILSQAGMDENLCLLNMLIRAYEPDSPNARNDSADIKSVLDVVQPQLKWLDRHGGSAKMFQYSCAVNQHMKEILPDELTWSKGILTEDGKIYLQDLITGLARIDVFANWLHKRSPNWVRLTNTERITTSDIAHALSVQRFIGRLYDGVKEVSGISLHLRWDAALRSMGISLMHNGDVKIPSALQTDKLRSEIDVDWYVRTNGNGTEVMLPVEKYKIDMWTQLTSLVWPVVDRLEATVKHMGNGHDIGQDELTQFQYDLDALSSVVNKLRMLEAQPRTRVDRVLALFLNQYHKCLTPYVSLKQKSDELRKKRPDRYEHAMRGLAEHIENRIYEPRSIAVRIADLFNNTDIGGLRLTSEPRLNFFRAKNWIRAHDLIERIVVAGALFASDEDPVHLHLSTELSNANNCTIICLDDRSAGGIFAHNISSVMRSGYLYPNYISTIPSLATQVAPVSMEYSIAGSSIRFPIATL